MRRINVGQWERDEDETITAPVRKLFRPYEHLSPPELTAKWFLTPVPEDLAVYELGFVYTDPNDDDLWSTCPACKHRFLHDPETETLDWVLARSPEKAIETAKGIDELGSPIRVPGLADVSVAEDSYFSMGGPWLPWLYDDAILPLVDPSGEMIYSFALLPQPPRKPGWLAVIGNPEDVRNWISLTGPDPEIESLKWPANA